MQLPQKPTWHRQGASHTNAPKQMAKDWGRCWTARPASGGPELQVPGEEAPRSYKRSPSRAQTSGLSVEQLFSPSGLAAQSFHLNKFSRNYLSSEWASSALDAKGKRGQAKVCPSLVQGYIQTNAAYNSTTSETQAFYQHIVFRADIASFSLTDIARRSCTFGDGPPSCSGMTYPT